MLTWPAPPGAVLQDRPATTAAAVELVAAEVGVLVVPQSLARAHHRKDLTYRVVTDAPTSSVGLAWVRDRHTDLVEEMIGIVRGRTANSTRGRPQDSPAAPRAGSSAGAAPAGQSARQARQQPGSPGRQAGKAGGARGASPRGGAAKRRGR